MIKIEDAKWLQGQKVRYLFRALPWEEPFWEDAIIMDCSSKRIRILHINAPGRGDVVKWVDPENLYE